MDRRRGGGWPKTERLEYEARTKSDPLVKRQRETNRVLNLIDDAIQRKHSSTKRLLVVASNAGGGKTWFLKMLSEQIKARWGDDVKLTDIFSVAQLINPTGKKDTAFHQLCDQCVSDRVSRGPRRRSKSLAIPGLVQEVVRSYDTSASSEPAKPLVVVLDDVEALLLQMQPPSVRFQTFRNAFLFDLLSKHHAPVIFVCAARVSGERGRLPYFDRVELQMTREVIRLPAFDEVQLKNEYGLLEPDQLNFVQTWSIGNPLLVQFFSQPWVRAKFNTEVTDKTEQKQIFNQAIDFFLSGRNIDPAFRKALPMFMQPPFNNRFDARTRYPQIEDWNGDPAQVLVKQALAEFDLDTNAYSIIEPLATLLKGVA
jgi:hypothetical protein